MNPRVPATPEAQAYLRSLGYQQSALSTAEFYRRMAETDVEKAREKAERAATVLKDARDKLTQKKADEDKQRVKLEEMLAEFVKGVGVAE